MSEVRLIDDLNKTKHDPVQFNDERWFVMLFEPYVDSGNKKFIMCKFKKNFWTLDYHVVGKTIEYMRSLSEAKMKAAILGIDLWMPS